MAVERVSGGSSLIDVLDRVLDKGIVIDAWVRISLVGIDLITVEARVVVASIDTYLKYAEAVGLTPAGSRPAIPPRAEPLGDETGRRRGAPPPRHRAGSRAARRRDRTPPRDGGRGERLREKRRQKAVGSRQPLRPPPVKNPGVTLPHTDCLLPSAYCLLLYGEPPGTHPAAARRAGRGAAARAAAAPLRVHLRGDDAAPGRAGPRRPGLAAARQIG